MNNGSITDGGNTIRIEFYTLTDVLSAVRRLMDMELCHGTDEELFSEVLNVLFEHLDLQRCALFVVRNGTFEYGACRVD